MILYEDATTEDVILWDWNISDRSAAAESAEKCREFKQPRKVWIIEQTKEYNLT